MKFTGEGQLRSVLLRAALPGAGGVELLGLLEAVALGVDVDDLGAMNEAIDERDDAGGVREDLAPLLEGLVGAEQVSTIPSTLKAWSWRSGLSSFDGAASLYRTGASGPERHR